MCNEQQANKINLSVSIFRLANIISFAIEYNILLLSLHYECTY